MTLPRQIRNPSEPGLNNLLVGVGISGVQNGNRKRALGTSSSRPLIRKLTSFRVVQRVRNRLRRKRKPVTTLPERLLRERDRILKTLGPRWKHALLALAGVHPGDAVLATFAYRLFSYWLPLPFGLVGLAIAPKARAPAGSASSSGSG